MFLFYYDNEAPRRKGALAALPGPSADCHGGSLAEVCVRVKPGGHADTGCVLRDELRVEGRQFEVRTRDYRKRPPSRRHRFSHVSRVRNGPRTKLHSVRLCFSAAGSEPGGDGTSCDSAPTAGVFGADFRFQNVLSSAPTAGSRAVRTGSTACSNRTEPVLWFCDGTRSFFSDWINRP